MFPALHYGGRDLVIGRLQGFWVDVQSFYNFYKKRLEDEFNQLTQLQSIMSQAPVPQIKVEEEEEQQQDKFQLQVKQQPKLQQDNFPKKISQWKTFKQSWKLAQFSKIHYSINKGENMTQFYQSLYDIIFSFSFKTINSQVLKKIFTIFTLYTLYQTNPYPHPLQISISPDLINKLCIFLDQIQDKRPVQMNRTIKRIVKQMLEEKIFIIGVVQGCKTVSFDRNGRPYIKRNSIKKQEQFEQLQIGNQESLDDQINCINVQQHVINYNPLEDDEWLQSLNLTNQNAEEYNQQKFEVMALFPEMLRVQKRVMKQDYEGLSGQDQKDVWEETGRIYQKMNKSDTSLMKTAQKFDKEN